jgi:hypothetical protein
MALTNCPECNKEISDKANSCPGCGFPINEKNNLVIKEKEEILVFPRLPENLQIGKQIVNWKQDAGIKGEFQRDENVIENIPTGKVNVILHTHGISLTSDWYLTFVEIHNSQIIDLKTTTRAELVNLDKSVIGRAAVGGLILGPLGAIIGGMSGVGSKEKLKDVSYLIINYWDLKTKLPQTLLIRGEKINISSFITRYKKETEINQQQKRRAEMNKGCLGVIIIPLIITFSYLTINYLINL